MQFFLKHKLLLLCIGGFLALTVGLYFYDKSRTKSGKKGFIPILDKEANAKLDAESVANGVVAATDLANLDVADQTKIKDMVAAAKDPATATKAASNAETIMAIAQP